MYTLIFAFPLVFNFVLATLVVLNGEKGTIKKYFALLITSVILWALSIYLSGYWQSHDLALLQARASFFFAAFMPYFMLRFSFVFPKQTQVEIKYGKKLLLGATTIGIALLSLVTDLVVADISLKQNNLLNKQIVSISQWGGLVYIYLLYFLTYVGYALFLLFQKLLQEDDKLIRKQILYFFIGLAVTTLLATLSSLILPLIISNYTISYFGPLFTTAFLLSTTLAIIKHRLFNIKIIATELFVFVLWVIILIQFLISEGLNDYIIRGSILLFVSVAGIFLIRSVIKEVNARKEIQKLADDLEEANKELKFMDKQKSKMLSIASHQFRSPLTSIKGYASLINDGSYGEVPEKLKEPLSRILKSSTNLARIVDDFLNISRIEDGRMDYNFKKTDIEEIAKEVVEEVEATVEQEGLSLNLTTDSHDSYPARVDVGKFKQVITNLVDNAIKYTQEGGITIQLLRRDGEVKIEVEDTGIGLEPEDREAIFEQFSRADEADEVNVIGSGLGLYIAKQIIEAHGGKIWATSPGKGEGSTFHVEIDAVKE